MVWTSVAEPAPLPCGSGGVWFGVFALQQPESVALNTAALETRPREISRGDVRARVTAQNGQAASSTLT
jgi:hypothetical protein